MSTTTTTTTRRHTYYGGSTITSPLTGQNNNNRNKGKNRNQNTKYPTFGPYIIGNTLGQGEFGKVKLGWSKTSSAGSTSSINSSPSARSKYFDIGAKQVAIKLIRRDTVLQDKNKEIKIYREINALKQLSHPNIVKLEEVLQNSKYIGIVLEYASGGEFYKYIQRKRRLNEKVASKLFAQLISGVNYIHSKGLVHRDLKLENLLLDKNENLIITDFGFVNEYYSHNELMHTSCGSPCYAAPELVVRNRPYEARKADVWSCGVILFAMLAGYLPWDDDMNNPDGEDISILYHYIINTPLKFPEYITPIPRDLLRRILVSDPSKRICLKDIENHKWLEPHNAFININPDEWDKISQSRNILRLPKPSKQYNQRPLSTCSMSSTGSKNGEKRDSLIMDSTLLSFPAPPRESQSHVLAIPQSPSSENHTRNSPSPMRPTKHNRNNSAASLALQAVVDAEREHFAVINSNIQNELSYSKVKHSQNNFERRSLYSISNGNQKNTQAITSSSLLTSKDNIISETSPIKPVQMEILLDSPIDFNSNKDNSSVRHNIQAASSSFSSIHNHPNANTNNHHHHITNPFINESPLQTNKLQYHSSHRKPRPTSYYPGLFSTVLEKETSLTTASPINVQREDTMNSSSTLDSGAADTSPFDPVSHAGPDTAATSSKSCEISPKLIPRRPSSVTSRVSVDVNGDLVKTTYDIDTLIRKVQEEVICEDEISHSKNNGSNHIGTNHTNRTPINERKYSNSRRQPEKRFSLFSFYSNDSSISTPTRNRNSSYITSRQNSYSSVKHNTNINNNSSDMHQYHNYNPYHQQHILKVSSSQQQTNILTPEHSKSSTNQPLSNHLENDGVTNTDSEELAHNPSTAKKVIDFFKRRSVRI